MSVKTSQRGLQDDWARATFILRSFLNKEIKTMKKVIVILTIMFLISSLPVIRISAETHKKSYDELKAELLERMERKDDTPFDFAALRLAYTETPDYNPYVR